MNCLALAILVTAVLFADPSPAEMDALKEAAVRAAVQRVGRCTVRIEAAGSAESVGKRALSTAPTTGVVLTSDGWIAASAYQLAGVPAGVVVTLPDGKRFPARIVGTDYVRKIAILKIDAQGLSSAIVAPTPRVGQTALAIGRTWSLERPSVSVGIVSALGRVWGKGVQTDAKVSPVNYGGPLADLFGRVIGILAPLSPSGADAAAGVEWYDAGVGFAIPLDAILSRLHLLQKGDLHPGLVGVRFKSNQLFSTPQIAGVRWRSPAAQAGLRSDDRIVRVAGQPTPLLSDFRYATGALYAGDRLALSAERGKQILNVDVTLAKEIPRYVRPFAGILARQKEPKNQASVVVREVLDPSPAKSAGVATGDEIQSMDGSPITNLSKAILAIRDHAPGEPAVLGIRRNGQELQLKLTLTAFPLQAPSVIAAAKLTNKDQKPAEMQPLTDVIVPDDYASSVPHGVIVWLIDPALGDWKKRTQPWRKSMNEHHILLVGVRPRPKKTWEPLDLARAKSTLRDVRKKYSVDPNRIALLGEATSAQAAEQWSHESDSDVQGLLLLGGGSGAAVDADPSNSKLYFLVAGAKDPQKQSVKDWAENLTRAGSPATAKTLPGAIPAILPEMIIEEFGRWTEMLSAF